MSSKKQDTKVSKETTKEELSNELSFGEQLVGIKFNPSHDNLVSQVKSTFAELANLVNNTPADGYLANLIKGQALRSILATQMLVVKFITLKY